MKTLNTQTLSDYLVQRSAEICRDNDCTADRHNCGSFAYIREDFALLDICRPDYFQGCVRPHAAIPLPWDGSQNALELEVAAQCSEFEDFHG